MSKDISVNEIVSKLDRRKYSEAGGNQILLQQEFGLINLVEPYIKAFPLIKSSAGRIEIMYWLCRFSKVNPEVIKLAEFALNDRSKMVRHHACGALAFANNKESVVHLRRLLDNENVETREDAKAAIMAITEDNHHLFADRRRTGKVYWEPGKI